MLLRDESAVSEVMGIALILMISSGAISVIVFWGVPYMAEKKATVALDSALFQLDVMQDMVDAALGEGAFEYSGGTISNSKTVNLKLYNGDLSLDDKGERFVIYYPVYDPKGVKNNMFKFDVSGFEPGGDETTSRTFTITVVNAKQEHIDSGGLLYFKVEDLITKDTIVKSSDLALGLTVIKWDPPTKPTLNNSIKITITYDDAADTKPPEDYGYIWLFDVGSVTYRSSTQSSTYRAIIENSCILSAHDNAFIGFFNEPKYWSQTLLDNTGMATIGILQTKRDPDSKADSIGSSQESFNAKISVKQAMSVIRANKISVYGDVKVKIYGDDAAVAAWRFYYTSKLGFVYYDASDYLGLNFSDKYIKEGKVSLFSLYHAICYVGMEAEN
jgi:hypothetical protein